MPKQPVVPKSSDLHKLTVPQLKKIARDLGYTGLSKKTKVELIIGLAIHEMDPPPELTNESRTIDKDK